MTDMLERAARAMCASQLYGSAWDGLNEGAQETFRANARAALLAALDPSDDALLDDIGEAYRLGMAHVLDNLPAEGPIGAINDQMKLSGARFVLNLLRARCAR